MKKKIKMSVPEGKEFNIPYPIPQPKAPEVFARIGFEDTLVPIKDIDAVIEIPTSQYLVGYEDAEGNECEEDGTYLNQNKEDE